MTNNTNQLKHFFSDRKGAERTETLETLNDYAGKSTDTINFSMLWCAGSKTSMNQSDNDALQYLFCFLQEVEKEYEKKTNLTIIFADTHAYLNGYSDSMYNYFQEIQSVLEKHNCCVIFSSELCKKKIVKQGFPDFKYYIDNIIKDPKTLFKQQAGLQNLNIETFYQAAIKHCQRIGQYDSGISFKDGKEAVMAYILFANFEKDIITEQFQNTIFITYMTREEGGRLPSLPIIRLYSIKSGLRTRPWFID